MGKRKLIRDAVHGDIEMTALEVELMDTPEIQRLRGIRQLGTAYLVFPSAVHTRFEHSLGTSWMAHRMLNALRRSAEIKAKMNAACFPGTTRTKSGSSISIAVPPWDGS